MRIFVITIRLTGAPFFSRTLATKVGFHKPIPTWIVVVSEAKNLLLFWADG